MSKEETNQDIVAAKLAVFGGFPRKVIHGDVFSPCPTVDFCLAIVCCGSRVAVASQRHSAAEWRPLSS